VTGAVSYSSLVPQPGAHRKTRTKQKTTAKSESATMEGSPRCKWKELCFQDFDHGKRRRKRGKPFAITFQQ